MNKLLSMTIALTVTLTAHSSEISGEWFKAAREGNIIMMLKMSSTSPEIIESKNEKGYTAFILATYFGNRDYALALLKKGADACVVDSKGNNALMGVLFKGHVDIIQDLIEKCDVNHSNYEGQTPLMYASLFGREEAVKKLILKGAKRELKDHEGRTSLSLAEGQWNQTMVSLLKTFRIIH